MRRWGWLVGLLLWPSVAGAEWTLTFQDEFDGSAGLPPAAHWIAKNERWKANGELQVYTNRPDNVFLDGQGHLVLRAKEEVYTLWGETGNYTSGRISTDSYDAPPTFSQQYGKWEARIKAPIGNGLTASWWTVGDGEYWPKNGEIDLVELQGRYLDKYFPAIHAAKFDGTHYAITKTLTSGNALNTWHVIGMVWEPEKITWIRDGAVMWSLTKAQAESVAGRRWPFDDRPHYPILSLNVGGTFSGPPDGSTVFPADFLVDYVRVWQDSVVVPPPAPTPTPDARTTAKQKLQTLGLTSEEADVTVNAP